MNTATPLDFLRTSASGAMLADSCQKNHVLPIHGLLAPFGTSACGAMRAAKASTVEQRPLPVESTLEMSQRVHSSNASAIGELRRLSGLTWEQLAQLFGTSRRALHFWISSKPMNAVNEERLQRILATVRQIDRGSAAANRAALVEASPEGILSLDLLAAGEYDLVVERLQHWARRLPSSPAISPAELNRRAPLRPEILADARHDPITPSSGKLISATPLGKPGR